MLFFFLRLILRFERLRIGSDNQAKEGRERGSKEEEGGEKRYPVRRECVQLKDGVPGDSVQLQDHPLGVHGLGCHHGIFSRRLEDMW